MPANASQLLATASTPYLKAMAWLAIGLLAYYMPASSLHKLHKHPRSELLALKAHWHFSLLAICLL